MTNEHERDLIGYGANPPDPKWPDGARLALNFVINVEEGSEPSFQDGEGYTEVQLTDAFGRPPLPGRDLAGEADALGLGRQVGGQRDAEPHLEPTRDGGAVAEFIGRCRARLTRRSDAHRAAQAPDDFADRKERHPTGGCVFRFTHA